MGGRDRVLLDRDGALSIRICLPYLTLKLPGPAAGVGGSLTVTVA